MLLHLSVLRQFDLNIDPWCGVSPPAFLGRLSSEISGYFAPVQQEDGNDSHRKSFGQLPGLFACGKALHHSFPELDTLVPSWHGTLRYPGDGFLNAALVLPGPVAEGTRLLDTFLVHNRPSPVLA